MLIRSARDNLKQEIYIAICIVFLTYLFFLTTDFMDYWTEITKAHEEYELDELLGGVFGGALALLYLSTKLLTHYREDRDRIYELSLELNLQLYYDQLTALPNRSAFKKYAQELIDESSEKNEQFTLFYVDLDNFKYINDMLGYSVGDKLLAEVGKRLGNALTPATYLARIGSDEFCILLPGDTDNEGCQEICVQLNEQISQPFNIDGHKLDISQTIGISRFPEDGDTYCKLLRIASIAMFMGKKPGQAQNNFKDGGFIADMTRRFIVQHGLNDALINKEFYLMYQPKIDLRTGKVTGSEALIRWEHPVHGLINPDEFISVAEESHTVHLIDLYVLEMACKQLRDWGDNAKPVAVNLSPVLFADEKFANKIFEILQKYEIPSHLIKFEITERTIVADSQVPLSICQKFSEAGIQISLDDFGTGYSSFSNLADYPIAELKIDRSFIKQICESGRTRNIVRSIVKLARSLNINVVAEGIETEAQYNLIKRLGCIQAQGYFIDRPLTVDHFTDHLVSYAA